MKIAMTDMDIVWEDEKANWERCRTLIKEAAEFLDLEAVLPK